MESKDLNKTIPDLHKSDGNTIKLAELSTVEVQREFTVPAF